MNIRTIIEFNPQSFEDTCKAMDCEKKSARECYLLPTNDLISLECLDALNTCGYEFFKPSDYGKIVFYKRFDITDGI